MNNWCGWKDPEERKRVVELIFSSNKDESIIGMEYLYLWIQKFNVPDFLQQTYTLLKCINIGETEVGELDNCLEKLLKEKSPIALSVPHLRSQYITITADKKNQASSYSVLANQVLKALKTQYFDYFSEIEKEAKKNYINLFRNCIVSHSNELFSKNLEKYIEIFMPLFVDEIANAETLFGFDYTTDFSIFFRMAEAKITNHKIILSNMLSEIFNKLDDKKQDFVMNLLKQNHILFIKDISKETWIPTPVGSLPNRKSKSILLTDDLVQVVTPTKTDYNPIDNYIKTLPSTRLGKNRGTAQIAEPKPLIKITQPKKGSLWGDLKFTTSEHKEPMPKIEKPDKSPIMHVVEKPKTAKIVLEFPKYDNIGSLIVITKKSDQHKENTTDEKNMESGE